MDLPKSINNVSERVIDDMKQRITSNSRLSVAAASFSLYAYEALKKELEGIDELRFIFTSPTFIKDKVKKEKREFYIPRLNRERNLYGSDFEIKLRNKLEQKAIAKECAEWIRNKVKFRTNTSQETMMGFFHVKNAEEQSAYYPFNEFTSTELGCERGNSAYFLTNVMPNPFAKEYLKIFNEQWNDTSKIKDVTSSVLDYIETVYQENSPEFIYFITLYNIFNEFLEDINEDVLPNEATGFKNSVIWNKLYNFQKDAALAIINKLERYNGCILADSVGLGKTFTALSIIKYYENRNKSVLVLCPKKLYENWSTFRTNYKNNPIVADRLRYDILFHSDLSRDKGYSAGLDLERINWGNYDLIVIDESHNFRNGGNVDEEDEMFVQDDEYVPQKDNRYQRLMKKVIRAGVRTKVLMLSATPVNNHFLDLKNQLQLAYEGRAAQFNEALGLERGINDIFRSAQAAFTKWSKLQPTERTTERLLEELSFDFFELLYSDLENKFANPINPGNKKVLIFTAFADTAEYLYANLADRIKKEHGLNVALITGSTDGRCTIGNFPLSFNNILTFFSPLSKDRDLIYPDTKDDIDVLIATDCISEGQNLQDCDYLINYDIHWNPVRIIQRFGRIDRIGSRNSVIQLVNYWPDMELDDYIDLKGRVESRMKAVILTSTASEKDNLLSDKLTESEKKDLEYRREQLKRLQEEVVDIEDMGTGINIMDLGLNEFRLDLLAYIKENPDVEHTPFGLHAVVPSDVQTPPGAVFILKNRSKSVNIDSKNRLHPFYMVYLKEDGDVVVNHLEPKKLLDRLRHLCKGKNEPIKGLCQPFNKETRNGSNMGKYSDLLCQAISSIINVKEKSDIDSFLDGYAGELFTNTPKGLDEFELICFFVVK